MFLSLSKSCWLAGMRDSTLVLGVWCQEFRVSSLRGLESELYALNPKA